MYDIIGILGGMGPAATCDLMTKIISQTDAKDDQHHIHICVDCNTNIPDRTAAILHNGESPVPELVKSALRLQNMGAQLLIMPCNTAHYFYDELVSCINVPLLHMPLETAAHLFDSKVERVGVLATDGTVKSRVYDKALEEYGIEGIYPGEADQQVVMELIYRYIKKGRCKKEELPVSEVKRVLEKLRENGAQKILLACTELPIAFRAMELDVGTIDPTMVLARAAIRYAGAELICSA